MSSDNAEQTTAMREMMNKLEEMMQQMMIMRNESEAAAASASSVRRSLIPELVTPTTAAKRSILKNTATTEAKIDTSHQGEHVKLIVPEMKPSISETQRASLQKGMAKPPLFEGNIGDNISTWWRQIKNYASLYETESQCALIKSYLRGPAALWMDSLEKELGREMTIDELANGLAQEYGSETTSAAALLKLETLSMASEECKTLAQYHSVFSRYYNLLNISDQAHAVRYYVKGIAPKYLKYMVYGDTSFKTLAEAKAAVTLAVAKHDQIELSYQNFNQQKGRGNVATSKQAPSPYRRNNNNNSNNSNNNDNRNGNNTNRNRRWESVSPYQVQLSRIADTSVEEGDDDVSHEDENERKEGQIAAVSSLPRTNRLWLNPEQLELLRKEKRCFNCHQAGHQSRMCRNAAALKPPVPLKGEAPSRRT
jgi:hypothetical protein